MNRFGEAVRVAREARGWTQQELASRAGVSQRAVSSWERGVSEPGDEAKKKVAQVLPLPPDVMPPGMKRRATSGGARLAELPFEELDPGQFENFAVSLAGELYPQAEAYRSGEPGHRQYGFDVTVERDGDVIVGIQCKHVKEFGPKQIEKVVRDATLKGVGSAKIFLSRSASPDARAALRKHPGWELWDRNKLSHAVQRLPQAQSVPLVDRYFPGLRERFLGVTLPGPWLQPDQYFLPTGRREQSSHERPLVGRGELLEELVAFAYGPTTRVGVIVGRGGTGKSKMLHALCGRLPARDLAVRFLERDPVIDHRAFEQLPSGRLLIIIDDAHDADTPIGKVVTGVLAANPHASVLLALRPDGEARARRQLREAEFDPEARWELTDLQLAEAEAVACGVLGPEHAYAAPRLAIAARDCPFLVVTGAILVREGRIELQRVEGDEQLRRELIDLLADTISSGSPHSELRAEVLHAAAALQPLRTADVDFRQTLEQLTGHTFDQLMPHLCEWEDRGILLRRGETYRVVPDLLGDVLLARAARARGTGAPTGYLERVHQAAGGRALAHLIINASRIDWQEPPDRRGQLSTSLWQEVKNEFQAGGAETRISLLRILEEIAFYQPRRMVELVRWALAHLAVPAQATAPSHTHTDQHVRDAVTSVLRTAAYSGEILDEVVGLLWEMARGDARPPHQHPNHALRILAELAAYDPRGISVFQQTLPALVERWLRRPRLESDVHDPLSMLHPLLATEAHQQTWSHDSVIFRRFPIDPNVPAVIELRQQALDLAFAQLTSPDPRRVAAAAETIAMGVKSPVGGSRPQGPEQKPDLWTPLFTSILTRLHDVVRASPPSPAIAVALRARLQWDVEHPVSEIHQAARDVLAALPCTLDYELARALHNGPIDPPADSATTEDYMDRERAKEQFFADCAAAIADQPDDQVVVLIERLLRELKLTLGDVVGRAQSFMWTIVTIRPSLGAALCYRVREATDSPLVSLISIIFAALGQGRDSRLVDLAWRLLETDDVRVAGEIAQGIGNQSTRADLLDGESALLRTLVEHPDSRVSIAALGAVQRLAGQHRDVAVELLTAVPANRRADADALGAFAWVFGPHGALSWKDLAQQHKDGFLDALRAAPSIDSYQVEAFLALLSVQDPRMLLDLLFARVQAIEDGAQLGKYTPLPYSWQVPLRFRECEDFPDLLRCVREWLAKEPASMWRHFLGRDLFAAVAGTYDAQTRQVIEEYLAEPDPGRIRTVATMLQGAPRKLVWDLDFVRSVLRAADAVGPESLDAVRSALYHAMITGPRWGAIGQPYPQDVEQRDTAIRLASQAVRGSVEEQFYRDLAESAETWIDRSLVEIDLPTDGRRW